MTEEMVATRTIYSGGYVPNLGIIEATGDYRGWLVYRHPDGQWVTLADLKGHADLVHSEKITEMAIVIAALQAATRRKLVQAFRDGWLSCLQASNPDDVNYDGPSEERVQHYVATLLGETIPAPISAPQKRGQPGTTDVQGG